MKYLSFWGNIFAENVWHQKKTNDKLLPYRDVSPRRSFFVKNLTRALYSNSSQDLKGEELSVEEFEKKELRDSFVEIEAPNEGVGYTWLTHWKLIEEDRKFREKASILMRSRQMERSRALLDIIHPSFSTSREMMDEVNTKISTDNKGILQRGSTSKSEKHSFLGCDIEQRQDELEWLENLPGETDIAPFSEYLFDHAKTNEELRNTEDDNKSKYPMHGRSFPESFKLRIDGRLMTVRPLWIAVHTDVANRRSSFYESVVPINTEVQIQMQSKLEPFLVMHNNEFEFYADIREGAWSNFFVGIVGDVGVNEAENLWPNQVFHRDRILYNVREASDIAKFLENPRIEAINMHLENLNRLAADRGYHHGWCWYMLKARWGASVLRKFGIQSRA